MDSAILKTIEKEQYKKRPDIKVGDIVKMHLKIKEGNKERVQVFEGIVIGIKGVGLGKTVTVRKISYGIGVEKIVPLYSTMLEKVEIVKRGKVKKSKLFFLRERVGRRALKVGNLKDMYETDEVDVPIEGEVEVEAEAQPEVTATKEENVAQEETKE